MLASCSGEAAPVIEDTPTAAPAAEKFDQPALLDKPLAEIGGITVICAGIKDLNQPFSAERCSKAAGAVNEGLARISEATGDAIPAPPITAVNIKEPLQVDTPADRCSRNPFTAKAFAGRILQAALAAPAVIRAITEKPDNVLHIVSESPVTKTCGDAERRMQSHYLRGKDRRPIVQFTGEGHDRDVKTAAHERLHRWLGHVVRFTYANNRYYSGERLDGSESFIESMQLGPTVMGDGSEPFLDAFQQLQLGVLQPDQVARPTKPGEITLQSLQSKAEGPRLLTMPLRHPNILGKPSFPGVQRPRYWAEQIGPSEVAVMTAGESEDGGRPDEPAIIALLHSGQPRFIDAASGFTITLESITETQAKLEVTAVN